jgi:hypothetical protein
MAFGKAAGLARRTPSTAGVGVVPRHRQARNTRCHPVQARPAQHRRTRRYPQHPAHGQALFSRSGHARAASIAEAIRHHHEAFSGSGYPDGLNNERITLGRMVAIIDNY